MSYLYVSTQGVGNAKGAIEGLGGLTEGRCSWTPTKTFMGQKVSAFTQDRALKSGENWRRDSNAAIQDLGAITDAKLNNHLDGRNFFGSSNKDDVGKGSDTSLDAGRSFKLGVSANEGGNGLVVARDCFTNATMEIALGDAEAARFGSVTVKNIANVNIRVGDGLNEGSNSGKGLRDAPCDNRLNLDTIQKGEFTVNVVNAEDSFIDASSAKFADGVDINIAVFSNDAGPCARIHTHIVAGSIFDDEVTITAGNDGKGGNVETGDNIKVFANLGLGDDTFDSTSKGGLVTVDRVIGGAGDDLIKTGAGKDTIFGDYDCKLSCCDEAQGDMVDWIGNGAWLKDVKFVDAKASISFVGSEAGFSNLLGYYYTNEDGQKVGKLVWDEDVANALSKPGKTSADIVIKGLTPDEAKSLQLFIIPDGAKINSIRDTNTGNARDGIVGTGDGMKVVVTTGSTGQGLVYLDKNGNGIVDSGDVLLSGKDTNGVKALVGGTFSGFFSDVALNPLKQDYTKNVGDVGDAFKNTGSGAGNPLVAEQDSQWGQIGFEDIFGGAKADKFDRDYDDAVLQVQVSYKVGKSYGDDTLYGGGGDDVIYGDDNCAPCDSKAGGDDVIYGDDGLICVGAKDINDKTVTIDSWLKGTGITIYGQVDGGTLRTISEGDTADLGYFDSTPADANMTGAFPSLVLGISSTTASGANFTTDLKNPEVQNGRDVLGFKLPTAADVAKVTLANFYAPDGSGGGVMESVIVKVGNDLNGNGILDAAEVIGSAQLRADGSVVSVSAGFVVAGSPVPGPSGTTAWAPNNPGAFDICFQAAGVTENCYGGKDAMSFDLIQLEAGGLFTKTGSTYAEAGGSFANDPSDFHVVSLCYVPEQGNDTIFGGGGDDTITAGGDRGHFSLQLDVTLSDKIAAFRNGVGYFFNDTMTGEFIDNRITQADLGTTTTIDVASNRLDKIGFFVVPDVAGSSALDTVGPGTDVTVGGPINLTPAKASAPGTVTAGSTVFKAFFDGINNPSPIENQGVPGRVSFGTVSDVLGTTGTVGLDDRGNGYDGDYNDVILQLKLTISDKDKGDWICGGQGADTFIWNGASGGACQLPGGRGDGFDVIKDFTPADGDKLIFDAFGVGTADVLDVMVDGHGAATLVFDQNYAAGTGVLLLGISAADAKSAIMFV